MLFTRNDRFGVGHLSAMGRYVELYIATPMCRSQLCVGCFEGWRQLYRAGGRELAELYIVTASAGTA